MENKHNKQKLFKITELSEQAKRNALESYFNKWGDILIKRAEDFIIDDLRSNVDDLFGLQIDAKYVDWSYRYWMVNELCVQYCAVEDIEKFKLIKSSKLFSKEILPLLVLLNVREICFKVNSREHISDEYTYSVEIECDEGFDGTQSHLEKMLLQWYTDTVLSYIKSHIQEQYDLIEDDDFLEEEAIESYAFFDVDGNYVECDEIKYLGL